MIFGEYRYDAYGNIINEDSLSEDGFELICGKECESNKCNFLCRWFMKKN